MYPCAMTFECAFRKERLNGNVEVKTINELMEKAWRRWYGDSTEISINTFGPLAALL